MDSIPSNLRLRIIFSCTYILAAFAVYRLLPFVPGVQFDKRGTILVAILIALLFAWMVQILTRISSHLFTGRKVDFSIYEISNLHRFGREIRFTAPGLHSDEVPYCFYLADTVQAEQLEHLLQQAPTSAFV